jgi:hypothetical protein
VVYNSIEITFGNSVPNNLFSLILVVPYIFTALALYQHNFFPKWKGVRQPY